MWPKRSARLAEHRGLPDRFSNGDSRNDRKGNPGCFDPSSLVKFHGGDYAGMRLQRDYLTELGVGAVGITPAYQQTSWCGYHGHRAKVVISPRHHPAALRLRSEIAIGDGVILP